METNWTTLGIEPTLEQIMADPITRLLMQSDGIEAKEVWAAVETVRHRQELAAQRPKISDSEGE